METNEIDVSGAPGAPRSGAPAGPAFLDNKDRNLPPRKRGPWSKKQWTTRRAVLDRLQYWQGSRYQVLWVTLTSAPSSPVARLRADFQVLRKRLDRDRGFKGLEYICVDTLEGHGVLHMLWAWRDPNPRKRRSFYVEFEWLQKAWTEIHGAFHVNVKRVRSGPLDAKRLSSYIVSQYCAGQTALVRVSQSRVGVPFRKMRAALLRTMRNLPERFEYNRRLAIGVLDEELWNSTCKLVFRLELGIAWAALTRHRSFQLDTYRVEFVWIDGELRRV